MKFLQKYIILAVLLTVALCTNAQDKKVVQVSGYIIAEGTEIAVPYVSIRNESYGNETFAANHEGFFSFVAHVGDEIIFSSIGYRSVRISIPNVGSDKFTTRIEMMPTIEELPVVTVGPPLPWASIEEFNIAFMNLDVSEDNIVRVRRSLSYESLAAMAAVIPRDGNEMRSINNAQSFNTMNNKVINQRYANPLLNPFAWGSLIQQITKGSQSRKSSSY
jgi:hypothetical protein